MARGKWKVNIMEWDCLSFLWSTWEYQSMWIVSDWSRWEFLWAICADFNVAHSMTLSTWHIIQMMTVRDDSLQARQQMIAITHANTWWCATLRPINILPTWIEANMRTSKFIANRSSMILISFEKRANVRPSGVVQKKLIGKCSTCVKNEEWMKTAALRQPNADVKSAEATANARRHICIIDEKLALLSFLSLATWALNEMTGMRSWRKKNEKRARGWEAAALF